MALSPSARATATASYAVVRRSCCTTSCTTRSTLIVRASAIPVSMSTSRHRWLGVMSTVEKAKPVTARPSPMALTCMRKIRSSTGELQGNSQAIDEARPSRRASIACSICPRVATSAMASQIEVPMTVSSSPSCGAPLLWANRAQERFMNVMRPSRSTV